MNEADRVVLVVDAREGLTPADEFAALSVRRSGKPVVVAVNKTEGREADLSNAEFYALGLGDPVAVAAAHGQAIDELMDVVLQGLEEVEVPAPAEEGIRVAVIGRPNVGKSTLINRLLGEERVIASDEPGTTRDTVRIRTTCVQPMAYSPVDTKKAVSWPMKWITGRSNSGPSIRAPCCMSWFNATALSKRPGGTKLGNKA